MKPYKVCHMCGLAKHYDDYYPSKITKRKISSYCRECQKAKDKFYRELRKSTGPTIKRNNKICPVCKVDKPLSDFGIKRDAADGHISYCKPCWNDYVKKAQAKKEL